MKIQFLGAAQYVTGSQYLLRVNDQNLLLDCGLLQGCDTDEECKRNWEFQFDPKELNAVILSHAHIDHSGNLPNLVKQGYVGPIYCTPATADLCDVMLRDSASIQESDAEYINRKIKAKGNGSAKLVEPLYTVRDAETVSRLFRPKSYNEKFTPFPGVTAHLVDAGHILGSASIVLDIQEPGRAPYRFWFSGDIGRRKLALLKDPEMPKDVEILLMESTYGDSSHGDPEEAYQQMTDVIQRTIKRGGKVIIPAFAVGRTQEVVYSLNRMFQEEKVPHFPVYVDSPLAVEASKVFFKHPELYDEETQEFIRGGRHPALAFEGLTYIQDVEDSKALNDRDEPMVIISASGMAEAGRIQHHLKNNIGDSNNTVLIVSYQAPHTLGRRLVEKQNEVKIFGDMYERRCEVVQIHGLSAHAGQRTLYEYATASKDTLKRVILVHGEEEQATMLQERLLDAGIQEVDYPAFNETMEI